MSLSGLQSSPGPPRCHIGQGRRIAGDTKAATTHHARQAGPLKPRVAGTRRDLRCDFLGDGRATGWRKEGAVFVNFWKILHKNGIQNYGKGMLCSWRNPPEEVCQSSSG